MIRVQSKPIPARKGQYALLPPPPSDWCSRVLALLDNPALDPADARSLRGWIAWRVLPASYWVRVTEIASRVAGTAVPASTAHHTEGTDHQAE